MKRVELEQDLFMFLCKQQNFWEDNLAVPIKDFKIFHFTWPNAFTSKNVSKKRIRDEKFETLICRAPSYLQ